MSGLTGNSLTSLSTSPSTDLALSSYLPHKCWTKHPALRLNTNQLVTLPIQSMANPPTELEKKNTKKNYPRLWRINKSRKILKNQNLKERTTMDEPPFYSLSMKADQPQPDNTIFLTRRTKGQNLGQLLSQKSKERIPEGTKPEPQVLWVNCPHLWLILKPCMSRALSRQLTARETKTWAGIWAAAHYRWDIVCGLSLTRFIAGSNKNINSLQRNTSEFRDSTIQYSQCQQFKITQYVKNQWSEPILSGMPRCWDYQTRSLKLLINLTILNEVKKIVMT